VRSTVAARVARAHRSVTALGVVLLLAACDGGSGHSGSAFVFLTVDGFSTNGSAIVSSVPSSTAQTSTTQACVTLRNNAKNPTVIGPTALDNVTIQSYTLSVNGQTFTFGTSVLVPGVTTGVGTNATTASSTATFSVIVVPAGAKGPNGTSALAQLTFRGRDGRGQSVSTDGAVTVVFQVLDTDSTCTSGTGGTGGGGTGGTGTGGTGGTGTTTMQIRRR
jgi:hypothetical protein